MKRSTNGFEGRQKRFVNERASIRVDNRASSKKMTRDKSEKSKKENIFAPDSRRRGGKSRLLRSPTCPKPSVQEQSCGYAQGARVDPRRSLAGVASQFKTGLTR
jgi:hypothetical protein